MTAAHLSGITNVKNVFRYYNYLINNLEQYHLVRLIAMYASIRHCSFQICSHIHPKSFDAGLNSMSVNKDFLTWLLNGWRLCCQPIRRQVWNSSLTDMGFNANFLVTKAADLHQYGPCYSSRNNWNNTGDEHMCRIGFQQHLSKHAFVRWFQCSYIVTVLFRRDEAYPS